MLKQLITITLVSVLLPGFVLGQLSISGILTDQSTAEPLIGANVINLNSQEGVITDFDGSYTISANQGEVIQFSYLGYATQEQVVGDNFTADLALLSDGLRIDEIVITGPGIKRQKRELGYSTENFGGDEIALSGAPNVLNALSGKSAGVNIASANGVEGGTSRITIRGNNNIKGNNQPLIIVDGVPIENPPGLTAIGRGSDWGSAINNINAEDIADINILKGPTAAAKYGTRGANGVILITTKKGRQRKGVGIEYAITSKFITPSRFRDVQNTFGAGGPISLLEPSFAVNADGELSYPVDVHSNSGPFGRPTTEQFGFYSTGVSWGPRMEGQMVRWWDGELRPYTPQPDNLGQYFQTGNTTTHNINFSNGGDFGSVRVSLSYQAHQAVVPNSDFDQYTFNIGSQLNISSRLTSNISVSYINFNRKNSPSLGDDNNSSFGKGILYSWPRSYKGLEETLNFNEDGSRHTYGGNYPFSYTPTHLWWNTYNQNTYLTRNKVIGSVGLEYNITDWLSASATLGLDFNLNEFEERFNPVDALGVNGARYSNELDRNIVRNNDFLLTAFKDKVMDSAFDIQFSVGGTRWSRSQYGINGSNQNWQNPWLFSFGNARPADISLLSRFSEIRYDKKINSVFSFLNLDYDDFLFLELGGRNDWSSSLPLDNNSYFYPSASLSFIASEALTMPFDWLSFVKLRAAYAQTASDTDPFLLDFVYNTGTFAGQQTATLPVVKPPSGLEPQRANSYEVGVTLGILEDRINIDGTYYYIESFDQILNSPVPTSSGATELTINNGTLENYGFELGIRAHLMQWNNGFWSTGLNMARNRNFVKSLGEGAEFLEIGNIWGDFGPKIMVREGEEYGTIYGFDYVRHENGQPILNDEGTHYEVTDNIVPVGNASPQLTGGWTNELKLGKVRVNSLIDYRIGGQIYAGSYVIGLQTGQSPQTLAEREGDGLPYVDPEGNERNIGVVLPGVYSNGEANDKVVHYYYKYLPNAGGWGKILTTPGILTNTWVKLRELSLSYSLPKETLTRVPFLQSLDVALVGRDLFYFYSSLPDRINPEGATSSGNAQGLEWASFPSMRSLSIRLSTKF